MVEQKQSAIQRIQVGLVGLVVVLLFVTLADMVLDRVSDGPQAGGMPVAGPLIADKDATPDEPLAELGVTPVAKETDAERAAKDAAKTPLSSAPVR
ncbi:MAG: hypothetical protein K9G27_03660 [Sphingomonadaceae bacterium]|nr:hypothetical protein [Sphingomonadaceae bacterium]